MQLLQPDGAALPPTPPILAAYPFQCICTDYFQYQGINYLVIVDRYSNWPIVERAQDGSKGLIEVLRQTFATYGIPDELSSVGGPEFIAYTTRSFCLIGVSTIGLVLWLFLLQITHIRHPPLPCLSMNIHQWSKPYHHVSPDRRLSYSCTSIDITTDTQSRGLLNRNLLQSIYDAPLESENPQNGKLQVIISCINVSLYHTAYAKTWGR